MSLELRRIARKLYDERELTVEQIGGILGVSRTSIYMALAREAADPNRARPAAVRAAGDCL